MTRSLLVGAFIVLLLTACEKARLDDEIRRLCEKDGGIKVFEKVVLPTDRFDSFGNVNLPSEKIAKPSDAYFYRERIEYLREGNPAMWRTTNQIVRRADSKLLGESVRYTRRGGDLPGPWHESSFSCPEITAGHGLEQSVFQRSGGGS